MSMVKHGTKIFSKPLSKRIHGVGGIKIAEAAAELDFLSFAVLCFVNSVAVCLLYLSCFSKNLEVRGRRWKERMS